MKIKRFKFFEADGSPAGELPPDELPPDEDEDEAELLAMSARIDALEAKNIELENELLRAHERCRVLEESRTPADTIPLPHFWGRRISE